MGVRVFVDADVLFSRTVRDWLFLLRNETGGGMFTLASSEDVLAEAVAKVRDQRPLMSGGAIARLRTSLAGNLDELLDEYQVLPWMLEGDAGDGHVRGACVGGGVDMLLTNDGVLLNDGELVPKVAYEPIRPDDFLVLLDDSNPRAVRSVTSAQCAHFLKLSGDADLTAALRKAGCPRFAERVNSHLHRLLET